MSSRLILFIATMLLGPLPALACDMAHRYQCKDEIGQLVAYRSEAMEFAFGNVFGALPPRIEIRFVKTGEEQHMKFSGRMAYDPAERVLVVPQRYVSAQVPVPLRWAASYWPYYRNPQYQEAYPVIAAIDNALWGAVLQETAQVSGRSWPHAECGSVDLRKRLPCEMLISGVAALLTENQVALFNSNPLERIWPEQFSDFQQRSWRSDRDYFNVRHYGGILLLQPLFSEFGVPSALTYVAQTPFLVEDDNMRTSALRYQERAREVLQSRPATQPEAEADNNAEPVMDQSIRGRRFIAFDSRDGA